MREQYSVVLLSVTIRPFGDFSDDMGSQADTVPFQVLGIDADKMDDAPDCFEVPPLRQPPR